MKEADYTVEYNKVFINLASLLLGTSLIFVSQVAQSNPFSLLLLILSWACWIASIYFGAQAIGQISKITGDAEVEGASNSAITAAEALSTNLNSSSVSERIWWQLTLFLIGFIALVANALFQAIPKLI
jgi:hypothetical protein